MNENAVSRRRVTSTLAWSVPAVAVTAAAPAMAASPCIDPAYAGASFGQLNLNVVTNETGGPSITPSAALEPNQYVQDPNGAPGAVLPETTIPAGTNISFTYTQTELGVIPTVPVDQMYEFDPYSRYSVTAGDGWDVQLTSSNVQFNQSATDATGPNGEVLYDAITIITFTVTTTQDLTYAQLGNIAINYVNPPYTEVNSPIYFGRFNNIQYYPANIGGPATGDVDVSIVDSSGVPVANTPAALQRVVNDSTCTYTDGYYIVGVNGDYSRELHIRE